MGKKGIQSKMTIDKLALIMKGEFDTVNNKIDKLDNRIDGLDNRMDGLDNRMDGLDNRMDGLDNKIDTVERNLREEFITSSDKIVGELQKMRQEHASSFGLYKELEQKVFTLEEKVEDLEKLKKEVRQLQLKLSHA